ncbi:uncharacterized protein LOC127702116 [Mytilus californianus]|uniref:uncharacterized protein LOC127702116 n=1 Tax=Mytilus californianus TaxID=6549 RepID=UPI00224742F7|nr:uncharacterized protein LOC127702116 [Mytilus californianus]
MLSVTKKDRTAGFGRLLRERKYKRQKITNGREPVGNLVKEIDEHVDSEESDESIKPSQNMRRKRRAVVTSDSESENDIVKKKRNKHQNTEYYGDKYNFTRVSDNSEDSSSVDVKASDNDDDDDNNKDDDYNADDDNYEDDDDEDFIDDNKNDDDYDHDDDDDYNPDDDNDIYDDDDDDDEDDDDDDNDDEFDVEAMDDEEEDEKDKEETEEGDKTNTLQIDNVNNEVPKGEMSIFRLDVHKVYGLANVKSEEQLLKILVKAVTEMKCVKHEALKNRKCEPFLLAYFYYKTERDINSTADSINRHRKLEDRQAFIPGSRKTGNILTYYRFKTSIEHQKIPEVYFLCNGEGYHAILHLCDTTFRSKIAKEFIDGNKIKEIETINIAGPDVTTKITYKSNFNIECHSESFLEKVVNYLAGYIKTDSQLFTVIQGKKGQDVLMKIGLNFVRVCKQMTYGTYACIFDLFSLHTEKCSDETHAYFLEALDYVQRVTNRTETGKLNKRFDKEIVNMILEKKLSDRYYLSHRFARDWEIASEVTLNEQFIDKSVKNNPDKCQYMRSIKSWSSAPTLQMVTQALYRHFPDISKLKTALRLKRIKLKFSSQNWQKQEHSLQDFVHGYIADKNEKCYKIAQKWFNLSGKFSQIINKNFQRFLKFHPLMEFEFNNHYKGSEILVFPWCFSNEIAKFELTDIATVLAINEESAETITDILCCSLTAYDKNCFQLTKDSCLLPYSSPFHKKLTRKLKYFSEKRKDAESTATNTFLFQQYEQKPEKIEKTAIVQNILAQETICCERVDELEESFNVINPVITKKMLRKIKTLGLNLKEGKVVNFLRSRCPLREDEYNELYLYGEQFSKHDLTYIPGDKILCNDIVLFDVLAFDEKNSQTFLFHVKKDLDHQTREACSQIRNAAELLWHDLIRDQDNYVQLFWENASTLPKGGNPSLIFLKEKMDKIGKDKYIRMFSKDVKITFVFAFMTIRGKTKKEMNVKKAVTKKDFKDNDFPVGVFRYLKQHNILKDNGCISESFIRMTSKQFEHFAINIPNVNKETADQLYSFLLEQTTYNLSTTTKLELLTLDCNFSRYQMGGTRHFDLKIMQIPSK